MKITFTLPPESTATELRDEVSLLVDVLDHLFNNGDGSTVVALDTEKPHINVQVSTDRSGTSIPPYVINPANAILK